ncbi:hypothetical protein COV13_00135 [Candidatus Woesearchaeota archaeon CG10_big_fil_rev_8_21_14_0_10_32_9]|nr:MAG: hypothetical protein COV13_00135 [Candidatus Woesearchaeota archaeon CG10_big_fil_rev_8_21_14_0_10_32_9]
MVQELSAVDVHFLSKEFKSLISAKIEKIYQVENTIYFRFYSKSGKVTLKAVIPGFLSFSKEDFDAPDFPPAFCALLRKHLSGAFVRDVYQQGFERILVFDISSKELEFLLIFELFKPGNVVLVKKPNTILDSFLRKRFKDRLIAPKKDYFFPPSQADFNVLSEKEFFTLVSESDRSLVKTLASLGLGGLWAEEVLTRVKISKTAKVTIEEASLIMRALRNLLSEQTSPYLVESRVFPVKMDSLQGKSLACSFSEALDRHGEEKVTTILEKKSKYISLIEIQEKRLLELEKEIVDNQAKGDFIYQNYGSFSELLKKIKELRTSNSLDELEELLKKNSKFKELNKKEKKIVLEF